MIELPLMPLHNVTRVIVVAPYPKDVVLICPHSKLALALDIRKVEPLMETGLTRILDHIPSRLLM